MAVSRLHISAPTPSPGEQQGTQGPAPAKHELFHSNRISVTAVVALLGLSALALLAWPRASTNSSLVALSHKAQTYEPTTCWFSTLAPVTSGSVVVPARPRIILFGDSLTERGFDQPGGWAAYMAANYTRRVRGSGLRPEGN